MLPGFELWVPPSANEYDDGLPVWDIIGSDAQIVQFPVRPGRSVMCFSGAMAYMSDGMEMSVKLAGAKKTFGRLAGGGSLFQVTYTNKSDQKGYVAMTPDYPGVIVPFYMPETKKIIAQRDSFLCSTFVDEETDISAGFNPSNSALGFCCAGVDWIVQTIQHGEWSFLIAMGTIITKTLEAGEKILVDTDSILCFEESVQIDVETVGSGLAVWCCAGEGIFNASMTGPGRVYLQSFSIDKMRKLFPPPDNSGGGGGGGGD